MKYLSHALAYQPPAFVESWEWPRDKASNSVYMSMSYFSNNAFTFYSLLPRFKPLISL